MLSIQRPKIYWLDNIDEPSVIEAYVSRDYAETGTARVKLTTLDIIQSSSADFESDTARDWGDKAWLNEVWEGVYVHTVSQDEWSNDTEVAADLKNLVSYQPYNPGRRGHRPRFDVSQGRMRALQRSGDVFEMSTSDDTPEGLIIFYRQDE